MKTIKIKTWSCPSCNYHQDFEPTAELMLKYFDKTNAVCPSCGRAELIKETNPDKKTIMTIIGEEDIETEIERIDNEKEKDGKFKMTTQEKDNHREKRKQDIQEAITKARLLEDK